MPVMVLTFSLNAGSTKSKVEKKLRMSKMIDFKDQILALADRVAKLKDKVTTEEATKNAFVLPFLECLGYEVFNPTEVVPEFTADIGAKKGEKVDYAVMKDGKPIIIIECKWWGEDLVLHKSQMIRYFGVTDVKLAILTNGIRYQFFTDLEKINRMDEKPFLDFDILEIPEQLFVELKKFHKSYFNIDEIINTASELKYSNEVRRILREELKTPSLEFTKHFIKRIYNGKATEKVVSSFTDIIKKSSNQLIAEIVNEKIKAALEKDEKKEDEEEQSEVMPEDKSKEDRSEIVTTEEEIEGYVIVKAVLKQKGVDAKRIGFKDTLSYFAIILDNSTWKTICRLWLNSKKKFIGIFDKDKKEKRHHIETIDDIYKFDAQLFEAVQNYDAVQK
jgi:hypothetical protein